MLNLTVLGSKLLIYAKGSHKSIAYQGGELEKIVKYL